MKCKYFAMITGMVVLCGVFATGCGDRKEPDITQENEEVYIVSEEDKIAETDEIDTYDESDTTDSSDVKVGSGEETTGIFAKAFETGEVENNGSFFVRIGDKVYYRVFNEAGIESPTLGGNINEKTEAVQAKIMSYNLKTGESECVGTTYGNGKMYAVTDGFVFAEPGKSESVLCTIGGPDKRPYLVGSPEAVSEDGRGLVTREYVEEDDGYQSSIIHIYYDDEEIATIEDGEGYFTTVFGYAGNNLFVMKSGYEDKKYYVSSYDETGSCTDYGKLQIAASDFLYEPVPEFEHLIYSNDEAYFLLAYYEGSGHYYAGYEIYKVNMKEKDSVSFVKTGRSTESASYDAPKIYFDGKDRLAMANHLSGEISLSDNDNGDLVYYTKPDHPSVLMKSFASESAQSAQAHFLDEAVAFGDDAFLITNQIERNSEGDIGWREAYDITEIDYLHIPFEQNNKEGKELATDKDKLETLDFEK
ncbi:hypothetical protein D6856_03745 [Butyrivibrio sp. XB500-5]|uniref:hypothetical protein n=1 Tax=Butyrivibrio sp. XB500-5 TaxID=2364880 RepID=UPI000EA932EF|nr:hypothetical protein [Butyrivibrio sp. XB500-5]RKM63247.1 hypothetical protein D6856_03745 [Butyrivibrio sp. XB500-5]